MGSLDVFDQTTDRAVGLVARSVDVVRDLAVLVCLVHDEERAHDRHQARRKDGDGRNEHFERHGRLLPLFPLSHSHLTLTSTQRTESPQSKISPTPLGASPSNSRTASRLRACRASSNQDPRTPSSTARRPSASAAPIPTTSRSDSERPASTAVQARQKCPKTFSVVRSAVFWKCVSRAMHQAILVPPRPPSTQRAGKTT